jgi:hypothetical protein
MYMTDILLQAIEEAFISNSHSRHVENRKTDKGREHSHIRGDLLEDSQPRVGIAKD